MVDETQFDVLAMRRRSLNSEPSPDTELDFSAMDELCARRAEERHSCAINHGAHTSIGAERDMETWISAERAEPPEPGMVDPALYGWSGEWSETGAEDETERYTQPKTVYPSQVSAYVLGGVGGAVIALALALHFQPKPVVVSTAGTPVVVMPPNNPSTATPKPNVTLTSETETVRDSDYIASLVAKGMKIMDRPVVVHSGHTACSLLGAARQPSISDVATMLVTLYGWPRATGIDIVTSAGNIYCPDLI